MHVCILTSARIFDITYGGEGRYATSLGKWLVHKSHDVTLMGSGFSTIKSKRLSMADPELKAKNGDDVKQRKKETSSKKPRVLYTPYTVYLLSRLVLSALWSLKILLINRKFPITLIHAQDTGYSGLAAVLSGKFLGIPVVISSHGIRLVTLEAALHGKLKGLVLRIEHSLDIFTTKNADIVLAANPAVKQYFEQYLASTRIDVVPPPINVGAFQFSQLHRDEVRREFGISGGKAETQVIGFVGRFSPEKNLVTLIESFAKLAKNYSSTKLVLVGTGPQESLLRDYVTETSINNRVVFYGVSTNVGRVLPGFDIFVLPSYTEGLSASLLEAMASGLAVICSDIPGNRQLINHSQEGLLFNPNNVEELQNAIRLLCDDESLRKRLGRNAKIKANQNDEEIIFPRILQYYRLLSAKKNCENSGDNLI